MKKLFWIVVLFFILTGCKESDKEASLESHHVQTNKAGTKKIKKATEKQIQANRRCNIGDSCVSGSYCFVPKGRSFGECLQLRKMHEGCNNKWRCKNGLTCLNGVCSQGLRSHEVKSSVVLWGNGCKPGSKKKCTGATKCMKPSPNSLYFCMKRRRSIMNGQSCRFSEECREGLVCIDGSYCAKQVRLTNGNR